VIVNISSGKIRPDANESPFPAGRRQGLVRSMGAKVKLDQKQPIEVREPDPAARLTPQNRNLMPQHRILRLKLAFRFEWRCQNPQEQP